MKKSLALIAFVSAWSGAAAFGSVLEFVDPFIGTTNPGHTYPGAAWPFGAVQPSPETGTHAWKYCAGYQFSDPKIYGFAQTHFSGTGWTDGGDVLLQPFAKAGEPADFASVKTNETAAPGLYAVTLADFGVRVRLTCSPRVAFYEFTFPGKTGRLLVDLQYGADAGGTDIHHRVVSNETALAADRREISGTSQTRNWYDHTAAYSIQFDRPYSAIRRLPAKPGEKAPRYVLDFDLGDGSNLLAKVSVSAVNVANARANIAAEVPGFTAADFETVAAANRSAWESLLSRIVIEGSREQKVNFYTSLYHIYLQPNETADSNGDYRGPRGKIGHSADGHFYSSFSLWDTFRAAHPLYTLLSPEFVPGFVRSMLAHERAFGLLPIITYGGRETYCMIGIHSVPVIADAYLKGIVTNGAEEAFAAIDRSLRSNSPDNFKCNSDVFDKYGYYPCDIKPDESVSRTLEFAYDNACAARFAEALGKREAAAFYRKRAQNYRNVFDPSTGFMRGRDSKGAWREPFDPMLIIIPGKPADFIEGNAWQWTWSVMHDPEGLISLMGGKEKAAAKLDAFFTTENDPARSGHRVDVTGLIGEYAQGNEPSHHAIYFYDYLGQPRKGQALIRKVFDTQYAARPDGLCGNDDCGQMSAWYVFSAMGFYPFDPCDGGYVLGAPQIPRAEIRLPNGKTFTVVAKNLSQANRFVKSVTLNGKPLKGFKLSHRQILAGGELVFEMAP